MDGSRFDELTRALGQARTRRSALKAFAAAIAGGAAVAAGLGDAEAGRLRAAGGTCRKNGDCASGKCGEPDSRGRSYCLCVDAEDCPAARDACHAAVCNPDGSCGFERCFNFQSDPENCGRCGQLCPSGVCENGACVPLTTTTPAPTSPPPSTTGSPQTTGAPTTPGFTSPPPPTTGFPQTTPAPTTTLGFTTPAPFTTTPSFQTTPGPTTTTSTTTPVPPTTPPPS
jgi:hypothetical protein